MNFISQLKDYKRGIEILLDWIGSGGVPVEKELAQQRANICISCEFNDNGIKLTETIADAIKEQIELKNHLFMRVNGERELKTCQACSCVLRLKIWCPISTVNHSYSKGELLEKFPSNCWQRTEQNL